MGCVAGRHQGLGRSSYAACNGRHLRLFLRLPFPGHRGLALLRVQVRPQTLHHLHAHQRDRQSAELHLQLSLLLFSRAPVPPNLLLHGRLLAQSHHACGDVKVRGLPVHQHRREFLVQNGAQDDEPPLVQLQQRSVVARFL